MDARSATPIRRYTVDMLLYSKSYGGADIKIQGATPLTVENAAAWFDVPFVTQHDIDNDNALKAVTDEMYKQYKDAARTVLVPYILVDRFKIFIERDEHSVGDGVLRAHGTGGGRITCLGACEDDCVKQFVLFLLGHICVGCNGQHQGCTAAVR